eukprot:372309_1
MDEETLNLIIAVVLASLGAIAQAIGYVVQKKGHNQVNAGNLTIVNEKDKQSYTTSCLWITGFLIYVIGSLLTAAALKWGAQSVVSPLGALTLVANTILATKFLGEPFEREDIWGIILVIAGSTIAVIFGPKSEGPDPTIDELIDNWTQLPFVIFFSILTGIAIIDFIGVKYYEMLNFNSKEQTKIIYGRHYLMISYVSLAAYFGSINVLFMKSIVVIIATFTMDYFTDWFFYMVIIGIVVVNLSLEFFRQRGLAYFGALFVVPIYQVLLILGASLMGAIYFNEFASLKLYELILFCVAIILTLIGVAILAFTVSTYLENFAKYIQVAWIDEIELIETNQAPQFPVWAGFLSEYMQRFYLTHDPFCFNKAMEAIEDAFDDFTDELMGNDSDRSDKDRSDAL